MSAPSHFAIPEPTRPTGVACRNLVVVTGDQLNLDSALWEGFDPQQDVVVLAEVPAEATEVWSHRARIAVFLSAMRHFALTLAARGWPVWYLALGRHAYPDLTSVWTAALARYQPQQVRALSMGDWRVEQTLIHTCAAQGVAVQWLEDDHFLCSRADFARWAKGKRQWLMEGFYREMRKRTGYLMLGNQPIGGAWNFDAENRQAFGKQGPGLRPPLPVFTPDAITQEVLALVAREFPQHPGSLDHFNWPVTPAQAALALDDFIQHRLVDFGRYQDAMWTDEPFLYHSLLAVPLNLKLLSPKQVLDAAQAAYERGVADLAATEGFIRQILGWREFIRGVYWQSMPALDEANHFDHQHPLPDWYWTGQTQMQCLRQSIGQTLQHGYAHHIQRLMVTGNFALLAGILPSAVSAWYRAVYVDAVAWVEMPNTLGMALYANGGRFTTKPYIASGAYIKRMSNYCGGCRYRPEQKTGPQACPFTTFYWDFLNRHQSRLQGNPRMGLMLKNLERLSAAERAEITACAADYRARLNEL
ncbi:cryptochrome/photolyase family protein [Parvibium lacunae]|uniref:Cryptochrome/photolyase family protein n=2 Tax=Parvibium lacunae TaxID=1888893 RepID=A0A368L8F3_9BURK|nr:cryptochrome/photolyase family protein [Parvibium lacunae]